MATLEKCIFIRQLEDFLFGTEETQLSLFQSITCKKTHINDTSRNFQEKKENRKG